MSSSFSPHTVAHASFKCTYTYILIKHQVIVDASVTVYLIIIEHKSRKVVFEFVIKLFICPGRVSSNCAGR
jgi:hypothetical protein